MSPVCIVGSSRSGTSMVTRILGLCGMSLGPEEALAGAHEHSNPEGYWEHLPIQRFNEELLRHLGGTWYDPPDLEPGWSARPDLEPFRRRARRLLRALGRDDGEWGWKDPRNSITLELWLSLLPDLKVVHCLRNPLEAAASLRRAVIASGLDVPVRDLGYGLRLWYRYQLAIRRSLPPGGWFVTHHRSWFHDPERELHRLLAFVGLEPPPARRTAALATVNPALWRNTSSDGELAGVLPPEALELYRDLCRAAGVTVPGEDPADPPA